MNEELGIDEGLVLSKELESAIYEQLLIYKSEVPTKTLHDFSAIPSNDLIYRIRSRIEKQT